MFRLILFTALVELVALEQVLHTPYPAGSKLFCFGGRCPSEDECCMHVDEPNLTGAAAPPGRCFTITPALKHLCIKPQFGRALVPKWCNDGSDCTDDECCVEWSHDPVFGRKRDPKYAGSCETLLHFDSECRADLYSDSVPRPDGLVKSPPCHDKYNCTAIDPNDNTLGVCL